ncbi:MAG: hypothetical protein FWD47_05925 [Treponema sp.]|nr:hypothetical protein [Treponema sp.]
MKKLFLILFITVLIGGLFAQESTRQNRENRQDRTPRPQRSETQDRRQVNPVTIDGILVLERGFIAVKSGDTIHFVPVLNRFAGFISEVKEGATVSIEGFGVRNFVHPVKMVIEGKTIEFNNRARMGQINPQLRNHELNRRQERTRPDNDGQRRNNPSNRRNGHERERCTCGCK